MAMADTGTACGSIRHCAPHAAGNLATGWAPGGCFGGNQRRGEIVAPGMPRRALAGLSSRTTDRIRTGWE